MTTTHPVQNSSWAARKGQRSHAPQAVTLRAYEVYKELHGEQRALIEGDCRGGFGVGELVAYLYAHSFPRAEWRERVQEAFTGMLL